jgi:hypothetical protein
MKKRQEADYRRVEAGQLGWQKLLKGYPNYTLGLEDGNSEGEEQQVHSSYLRWHRYWSCRGFSRITNQNRWGTFGSAIIFPQPLVMLRARFPGVRIRYF